MQLKTTLILFIFLTCFSIAVKAQVTIGSGSEPHKDALLDLKQEEDGNSTRGLIMPRVKLSSTELPAPLSEHVAGMTVYNVEPNSTGAAQVYTGFYYNNGERWVRLIPENTIFFYAPSIVVPTDINAPGYDAITEVFTLKLHEIYRGQFGMSDVTSSARNPAAGALPVMAKDQLDYFVTYYDNAVFSDVAVSNDGELTYKLRAGFAVTEKTFMNVVFKIK
jgi:hypothetical protein